METRKITRNGRGTYYISVPRSFIKKLKWRERQKVNIKITKSGLSIFDWKK